MVVCIHQNVSVLLEMVLMVTLIIAITIEADAMMIRDIDLGDTMMFAESSHHDNGDQLTM